MPLESIIQLAERVRERFFGWRIDDIAAASGILLVRSAGPHGKDAGWAMLSFADRPVYLESLARPGEAIRVRGITNRVPVRTIVINPNAGISEPEIFWHEYY